MSYSYYLLYSFPRSVFVSPNTNEALMAKPVCPKDTHSFFCWSTTRQAEYQAIWPDLFLAWFLNPQVRRLVIGSTYSLCSIVGLTKYNVFIFHIPPPYSNNLLLGRLCSEKLTAVKIILKHATFKVPLPKRRSSLLSFNDWNSSKCRMYSLIGYDACGILPSFLQRVGRDEVSHWMRTLHW